MLIVTASYDSGEGRMPQLARDPPHAISIILLCREQKAKITDCKIYLMSLSSFSISGDEAKG